jgi:mono/diheme cytochrome c family protein
MKHIKIAAVAGVLALAGAAYLARPVTAPQAGAPAPVAAGDAIVAVSMPALEGDAAIGQKVFAARCAECHGTDAGGVEGAGPPLIHNYYEPNHHGDAAFFIAAEQGVRAHHWRFGDMPPVEGISRAEVAAVVAFVRKVQRENGIY